MTKSPKIKTPDAKTQDRKIPKAALIRERLAAPDGVTLSALCAATGWQAHSLRAVLSGLRKAGTPVERLPKADGESEARYRSAPSDQNPSDIALSDTATADAKTSGGASA